MSSSNLNVSTTNESIIEETILHSFYNIIERNLQNINEMNSINQNLSRFINTNSNQISQSRYNFLIALSNTLATFNTGFTNDNAALNVLMNKLNLSILLLRQRTGGTQQSQSNQNGLFRRGMTISDFLGDPQENNVQNATFSFREPSSVNRTTTSQQTPGIGSLFLQHLYTSPLIQNPNQQQPTPQPQQQNPETIIEPLPSVFQNNNPSVSSRITNNTIEFNDPIREDTMIVRLDNVNSNTPDYTSSIITQIFSHILNARHANSNLENGASNLTNEEIQNALEILPYSTIENPITDICPISQTEFTPDQMIARIRSCGHIFNEPDLRQWLSRSGNCPVCRTNVRRNTSANTST